MLLQLGSQLVLLSGFGHIWAITNFLIFNLVTDQIKLLDDQEQFSHL